MSEQIAVRIPTTDLDALDALVEEGRFPSRAAAVRAAIDLLLRAGREEELAEEYRRAYGADPQEAWPGEVGLRLGAELLAREGREAGS